MAAVVYAERGRDRLALDLNAEVLESRLRSDHGDHGRVEVRLGRLLHAACEAVVADVLAGAEGYRVVREGTVSYAADVFAGDNAEVGGRGARREKVRPGDAIPTKTRVRIEHGAAVRGFDEWYSSLITTLVAEVVFEQFHVLSVPGKELSYVVNEVCLLNMKRLELIVARLCLWNDWLVRRCRLKAFDCFDVPCLVGIRQCTPFPTLTKLGAS